MAVSSRPSCPLDINQRMDCCIVLEFFSSATAPFYLPTSSAPGFQFPPPLSTLFFSDIFHCSLPSGYEVTLALPKSSVWDV